MREFDRRWVLAGLGAGLVGGCAVDDRMAEKKPAEGGIGGTGIIGVLTGFGSLLLNGQRVEIGADAAITTAFGPLDPGGLSVGQLLTVEASGAAGELVARRIHVTHPVIGRVERVVSPRRARVAGVAVELEPGATGTFASGALVAVSGLWSRQGIVASRVDRIEGAAPTVLSGTLNRGPAGASIGGRRLQLPPDAIAPNGSFVTAIGAHEPDALRVLDLQLGRFFGAAGPLKALSVEGYLEPTETAPFHRVAGLGHSFDEAARLSSFIGQRALFEGAYVKTFAVETGIALPEGIKARSTLLTRLLTEGRDGFARPTR